MDHWQYLLVLTACLVVTAPLEFLGPGVYRYAKRTALAVLPVAGVFIFWDLIAIAADVWSYNPQYVTGLELPGRMPVEELLFFVVIPLCGLLTFNAVEGLLGRVRASRAKEKQEL